MSTNSQEYEFLQINGPLSIVPITPEQTKGKQIRMYILMGPSGSGKSFFIESLAPDQHLNISKDSLESVTQNVTCYHVVNLTRRYSQSESDELFVLMDTPGFLDPRLSEGRITRKITESLAAFRQENVSLDVLFFYFQPITDIRIGGSKQDAVKILREYVKLNGGGDILVITTMWNRLSTPKQLEDAHRRLGTLKNEIYTNSGVVNIRVTKFDTSQAPALSFLNASLLQWCLQHTDCVNVIEPQYQSLVCHNLLGRITNLLQRLQILAEDKRNATRSGSQDHGLLEVVLRDEKVVLASLQSFLDDLASDYISSSGMMELQSLLDAWYEEDPGVCSSRRPLSQASSLTPSNPLPADAPQCIVASDIPSDHDPAPVLPLQVPGLDRLGITPTPVQSASQGQPSSSNASRFAPIAAAFKRQFNRTRR